MKARFENTEQKEGFEASNRDTVRIAALARQIFNDEVQQADALTKHVQQACSTLNKFVENTFVKAYMEKTIEWRTFEKDLSNAVKNLQYEEGRAAAGAAVEDDDM